MTFVNTLTGYKIIFMPAAQKAWRNLPGNITGAIQKKLQALVAGAHNLDVKKLAGRRYPTYRLRVGSYRVLYEVYEKEIVVRVIRVAHRKEAYDF